MTVSYPIKDIEIINQIKEFYKNKNQIRDLLLFTLAINTGLNLQDLLKLNISDVKDKTAIIAEKDKSIPLNEESRRLIAQIIEDRGPEEPLFITSREKRLERSNVFRSFREVCTKLHIADKFSVASWRKTFAYHYYKKYRDLSYLQWLFNQSDVNITFKFIDEQENMNLRYYAGINL